MAGETPPHIANVANVGLDDQQTVGGIESMAAKLRTRGAPGLTTDRVGAGWIDKGRIDKGWIDTG